MKRVELNELQHSVQIGDECKSISPNVKESCIFTIDGEDIGFYLRQMPKRACDIAQIANNELRSERVPKSEMRRSSGLHGKGLEVRQYSTIIGSVPPKPHMRRPYPTISSVHGVKSAQNYIKSMLMLCNEAEQEIKKILPDQYERQKALLQQVDDQWRFGDLFTSSIANYNISAAYHRDAGNIIGTCNVIITMREDSYGGNLNIPDYGATIDQTSLSMLVYPAWRNMHGVTPIKNISPQGYRNSLVFYALAAFKNK